MASEPVLPPGFQSRWCDFEGIPVHYVEGGAGPPLLMFHGVGPGTSALGNFHAVLEPLSRNFRVRAVDLVGFGRSGRKPSPPFFDFDCWSRQVCHMVDLTSGGPLGIIGHSVSGALALRAAARTGRVQKLLTTGSVGTRFQVNKALETVWTFPATRDDLRKALSYLVHDASYLTAEFIEDRISLLHRPGYREYFEAMFGGDRQRLIDSWVIGTGELERVHCDVVMVHGRNDRPCPADATTLRLAQSVKHADVLLLAACGHSPALEHPDKFLMAVDLLWRR